MRFPRFQDSTHSFRVLGKPNESVPIGRDENCAPVRFQNAKSLGQGHINIGDILSNLCAYHDVKRRIRLVEFGGIANFVRQPRRMLALIAKSYQITRNIDAKYGSIAANNSAQLFAKKTWAT